MRDRVLLDSNDLSEGSALQSDVCIVGGGAAGITLALELSGRGLEVLLLESGGEKLEPDTQELYAGSVSDERLHSPPIRYRQRILGGTSSIWGGRCMPFDPVDFETRDYVAHSGWPIERASLLPFYERANHLVEAGDFDYSADSSFKGAAPPMMTGFSSGRFSTDSLERFSAPTHLGQRYRHKLAASRDVRVLLHANVVKIELDPAGGRVVKVAARSLHGRNLTVTARDFVLAAGGLEVPRLLLSNRDVHAAGIGNQHDLVGRYYMCHLAGTIGRIAFNGPLGSVHHGYDISDDGVYCRRRLALLPGEQRARRLGNFVARLHHPRITDAAHKNAILSLLYLSKFLIPYEYGKRLHNDHSENLAGYLKHVRNVVTGPFDAIGFAWHMLRDRKLADRKFPSIIIRSKANLYSLDFHAEQEPNPASRVTLSEQRDALGTPRINVDWRYTETDVRTVTQALALLKEDIARSGIGTFDYDPASVEEEMTRYGAYGGHHIGTARMGSDPRSSVVDVNCRIHGVSNLFIAGAATFPTSSQANPTLTVVAMALRLASHLQGSARA